MHLVCPHCHNPIERAEVASNEEVVCSACGSSFRLEQGGTTQESPNVARRMLGKFELREKVGVGAFGTVYKAWDKELERLVAIKVPRAGNLSGEGELNRFLREARSAAQLRHPGIVPIFEVGQAEGMPFLVSDFVKGITLEDSLTGRQFTFKEAAQLIADVAESLQIAHAEGVIHRDVKPSNIMLADNGKPQLMDFGLAKRDAGEITMTLEGQVLGTPAYMSPEQARGEAHQVDGRSDVYSLGVILYRLVTGELPFRGNTRMLLHQVLEDEPKAPRSLNDKIPRDLDTICQKAMAKEPSHRYQTARELAEDLGRFVRGEPILARPVGRLEHFWRWAQRNRAVASLAALAALLFLATFGAVSAGLWSVSQAKKDIEAQRDIALKREEEAAHLRNTEAAARHDAETREREARANLRKSLFYQAQALRQSYQPGRRALALDALRETALLQRDPELRAEFIRCLDLADLQALPAKFLRAKEEVLAFRKPGQRILTQASSGNLAEYDLVTGKLLKEWPAAQTAPNRFVWSPDGRSCVLLNTRGKRTQLLELDAQKPPRELNDARGRPLLASCAAFSPGSDLLALAARSGENRFMLLIYGLDSLHLLKSWEVEAQWVECLKLPASGDFLAASLLNRGGRAVRLWQVVNGKECAILQSKKHMGLTTDFSNGDRIDVSNDGRLLAATVDSGGIAVYSLRLAEGTPVAREIASFAAHLDLGQGGTLAARFSPDGQWLATIGEDGPMRLWEARSGALITQARLGGIMINRHDFVANRSAGLQWSSSGSHLMCNLDRHATLWKFNRPLVRQYRANDSDDLLTGFPALAYSPGDRWLCCATTHPALIDLENPDLEPILLKDQDLALDMAFAPGSDRLWKQSIWRGSLWQLPEPLGKPLQQTGKTRYCESVAFSPDGQRIACGTENGLGPKAWNLDTGRVLLNLAEKSDQSEKFVRGLKNAWLSADGGFLASYFMQGSEGLLRVFDLADGSALCTVKLKGIPRFCALAEQARFVAVSDAREILIFDPRTGRQTATLAGHDGLVTGLACDGTGRLLASSCLSDGTTRLWNPATADQLATFPSGQGAVLSLALGTTGRWLATGDISGRVRLWDLAEVRQHLKEAGLDWPAPPIPTTPRPALGSAAVFLAEAQRHHLGQHYSQAVAAYDRALALDDKLASAYRDRGEARVHLHLYAEAVSDFDRAKELAPELPRSGSLIHALQFYALSLAEAGQWKKAETELLKAIKNGAEKDMPARDRAVLRLAAGDLAGYRKTCDGLIISLMGKEKPAATNPIVWTCVLAPNAFPEYNKLQELAEDGADSEPRNWLYQNTLGAVLCRAGQHETAVERLNHSIQVGGKEGQPRDWLFLAVAYYHLGHSEDARKWLDKASRWLDDHSSARAALDAGTKLAFNEELELLLLRREARGLLQGTRPVTGK